MQGGGAWLCLNLINHPLLIPMGKLTHSEGRWKKSGLEGVSREVGGREQKKQKERKLWLVYKINKEKI